jgi:hypothetical protein
VIFGPLKLPGHGEGTDHGTPAGMDLSDREVGLLIPLAIAVFVIGFAPTGMLDSLRGPIDQIRAPVVSDVVPVAAVNRQRSPRPDALAAAIPTVHLAPLAVPLAQPEPLATH